MQDFIVSNVDGRTAGHELTYTAVDFLRDSGFRVGVNQPYKGGYIIRRYGSRQPGIPGGVHSLQIEINRSLYLDEENVTLLKDKCEKLLPVMMELCQTLLKNAPRRGPIAGGHPLDTT